MSLQSTFEQLSLFEQAVKKANLEHFQHQLRDFCERVMQAEAERLGSLKQSTRSNGGFFTSIPQSFIQIIKLYLTNQGKSLFILIFVVDDVFSGPSFSQIKSF